MKHLLPWVALAFVALVCLALIDRACSRPDPSQWVRRADYDAQAQAAAVTLKGVLAKVDAGLAVIADKNQVIADLTAAAGKPTPAELAKDKEIAALERRVADYESQGDLAGALAASKSENAAWASKFALAEQSHQATVSALTSAWQTKFNAQVSISDAWRRQYEDEHALRLAAESVIARQGRTARLSRIWKYAGPGLALVAGYLIGR